MKKILILFILSFITSSSLLYGQDLEELLHSFEPPIFWKKNTSIDTSFHAFYDKGKIAKISLTNGTKYMNIFIFDRIVLNDKEFLEAQKKHNTSSSCRNYNTNNGIAISSISTLKFYILPELCSNCDFDRDKKCKRLQKSYIAWTKSFY